MDELVILLHKSKNSIFNKASRLKLTKAKYIYIYTKNDLIIIAKKYKTKTSFRKYDYVAYTVAKNMGILDEITSHIIKNFSIPQLTLRSILEQNINYEYIYNDRSTLIKYELDIYYPKLKLAFEFNSIYYHTNKERKKADREKIKICKKMGITLIVISEITKKYEVDIKDQLISNLNILKKYCKITKSNILNTVVDYMKYIQTIEDIKNICLKYDKLLNFKKEHEKLYRKLKGAKLLKLYTSHMKRLRYSK